MSTATTKKPRPTSCKVCKPKPNGYWCIPCNRERFRQEFSLWTSGNKHIDNFIQTAQIEATRFEHVIEWIPFDRFENVEFVAEGGFGRVYKAKWKDGQISGPNPLKQLGWWRKSPCVVALKSLNNSIDIGEEFLDELKSHLRCIRNTGDSKTMVPLYGITQDTESEEKNYMMVTLFAEKGSMRDFMKIKLSEFVWSDILLYLKHISKGLLHIHNSGLIHRDFHSGNILFEGNLEYIADFGLSKPADSNPNDYKVFGILPYVAPELLGDERGKAYTQASDIYSFGILMWELVTCVPPYKDESYVSEELRIQIRKGRRPEIDDEFPECYAQLMKECWSENPDDRPKAEELHKRITEFQIGYAGYDFDENYNPIYKDIFAKAQVKRKIFLEQVYKIENNIDSTDEKKDLDDHDDKILNKRVDRYFSPPHPEAYTRSRLLSNLNNYRQPKIKEEISEVTKTLETLTVNNFNSGMIDISFDD